MISLCDLQGALSSLQAEIGLLRRRVVELENEAARRPQCPPPIRFRVGDRVEYFAGSSTTWTGIVIPRPADKDPLSRATRQPLTFVLRDGDSLVCGCFASRLRLRTR